MVIRFGIQFGQIETVKEEKETKIFVHPLIGLLFSFFVSFMSVNLFLKSCYFSDWVSFCVGFGWRSMDIRSVPAKCKAIENVGRRMRLGYTAIQYHCLISSPKWIV